MSDINIVLENRDDIRVAVEEKDINVEVPAGKDGRSLHPRGEWSASAAYAYLDLVSYDGSSYVATKAVPAGTLPTDTSYWMLSAEKGDPGTPEWGAITGDLSDQTDLQDALLAKAPVILNNASGSIASFADGSPAPVTALSVSIEPVQDLHGYSNPWPAGGGKNLLKPPSSGATINGVTFTVNSDGTITANGTATANADFYFVGANGVYADAGLASGQYILTGQDNTGGAIFVVDSGGNTYSQTTTPSTITFDSTKTYRIFIRVNSGTTRSNYKYYPMIRLASVTDATYAPYSNICPINGWSSATVTRTGKNVIPYPYESEGTSFSVSITINEDKSISISGTTGSSALFYRLGVVTLPAGTYKLSSNNTVPTAVIHVRKSKNYTGTTIASSPGSTNTFTLDESATISVMIRLSQSSTISATVYPQIELYSTVTAYEAPQIQQVTIDLDGTRYGGTLDVLTGQMTVDRVCKTLTTARRISTTYPGSIIYNNQNPEFSDADITKPLICNRLKYAGNNSSNFVYGTCINASGQSFNLWISDTAFANVDEATAWLQSNETQVCYYLATPLTITLSPSQMTTLLGQNNIWSDTGDTAVEYRADTKLFVQGQIAQSETLTRKMIADSATADGKAPKSLATGDLIIVGDELRKATANIGNGSAITASNSTTATLADVIKALQ